MTLLDRAQHVIPSATQTFSKSAGQWPGNAPSFLERGRGAHVWDTDGKEYIDFTMALGPIILGYQDPDVELAVAEQLASGPIFSRAHRLEVEVAETLVRLIPCAQPDGMVKFGLTGTDATTAAVRCARAYTGRNRVISLGYHGWADWCCPNRAGVLMPLAIEELTSETWAYAYGPAACLIIEPDAFAADRLLEMRRWCDETGTVLIFDEVLTGFRVALGGYQAYSGITPDLATFSKAMGNGYPVSAIVGKHEIMQTFERIGYSGTFLGETIGLAAAQATIAKMERGPVIDRLWMIGEELRRAFNGFAAGFDVDATLIGLPPRLVFQFAGDTQMDPIIRDRPAALPWRTLFAQEMIARGVLANFGFTACYAHSDRDVEAAVWAMREAFQVLALGGDPRERIRGPVASPGIRG